MKKFYLLQLKDKANKVVLETEQVSEAAAIAHFKNMIPTLPLNEEGYYRNELHATTYCVAVGMF